MTTLTIKKRAHTTFSCLKKTPQGIPEDITNVSIYAAIRERGSKDLVEVLEVQKDSGVNGTFKLLLSPTQSARLKPQTYEVQIEYTHPGDIKEILDPFPVTVVETGCV